MKQFEYTIKVTVDYDGYDTLEAKNLASAKNKLDKIVESYLKLEGAVSDLKLNANFDIDYEVHEVETQIGAISGIRYS